MHAPVKIDDTVLVVVEVKSQEVTSNPKKGVQTWLYSVQNQRDETVMSFDYKMMFHLRGDLTS
jgi:acyl dehydratase